MFSIISLKSYMIIGFVLVATIPILIIGTLSLQTVSGGMKKEIEQRNFLLSQSLAGQIERFLSESVSSVRQVKTILEEDESFKQMQISRYLDLVIKNYAFFDRIKILDQKGIVRFIAPFDKNIIGINLSNQIIDAPRDSIHKPKWSNTFLSLENGFPTISLSMEYNQGTIVADLNLATLSSIISGIHIGSSGYAFVVDKNGVTIAHIDNKKALERENVRRMEFIHHGLSGEQGTYRFNDQNLKKIASISPIRPTGWLVAIVQTEKDAYASISYIELILLFGTIFAIVFALIIAFFILRRVLVPLFQLTKRSRDITEGKYQGEFPGSSYREINDLSSSFKKMLEAIAVREEMLKSSEEKFRTLIETIPHGIRECNLEGIITFTNPAYDRMFNAKEGSLIGKPVWHDMPADEVDVYMQHHQFVIAVQPPTIPITSTKITPSGEIIDVQIDWEYKRDEDNQVVGYIAIITDISKRKAAEKGLQKSNEELEQRVAEKTKELNIARELAESANQAKSEFLSNISHELRTPMHQILSYSKFGFDKSRSVSVDKIIHYFSQIRIIGGRLMALLNDLLDLSKLEAGQMEYHMECQNIHDMIQPLVDEFKSLVMENGIQLLVEESEIDADIVCDRLRIQQVIRNLLSNAIKFTPESKSIIISFQSDQRNLTDDELGDHTVHGVRISVKDQGIGIPEDELTYVFDKFIQSSKTKTGAGGTGLGLAICREFILAHKGDIWVENNADGGSTFSFFLPH